MAKEEEKYHLHRFLEARTRVTGKTLEIVRPDESPDFVVRRETGSYAGVELTRVFLHSQHPDDPAFRYDWSRNPEIIDEIYLLIGQKAENLRSEDSGWSYRLQTILVALLMDVPLGEVVPALDAIPRCDVEHAGFREIRVADMDPVALDAFMGDIRLYGPHPQKWHGFHERANPYRKPLGVRGPSGTGPVVSTECHAFVRDPDTGDPLWVGKVKMSPQGNVMAIPSSTSGDHTSYPPDGRIHETRPHAPSSEYHTYREPGPPLLDVTFQTFEYFTVSSTGPPPGAEPGKLVPENSLVVDCRRRGRVRSSWPWPGTTMPTMRSTTWGSLRPGAPTGSGAPRARPSSWAGTRRGPFSPLRDEPCSEPRHPHLPGSRSPLTRGIHRGHRLGVTRERWVLHGEKLVHDEKGGLPVPIPEAR